MCPEFIEGHTGGLDVIYRYAIIANTFGGNVLHATDAIKAGIQ